jgi:hypothetical protein
MFDVDQVFGVYGSCKTGEQDQTTGKRLKIVLTG